ncbi:MAG: methyl-accepting chemotaxis protein [bacterium]|nr:methyl-accepting chemotaxis protein [bacterium]
MNFNPFTWSMSFKIPAMIVAVGVVAIGATGTFSYFASTEAIEHAVEAKLTAVLEDREVALSDWLKSIEGDLIVQASNPVVKQALVAFTNGWQDLQGNQKEKLQRLYIKNNPHPTGEKEKLDAASDGSAYSTAHAQYHPYLRAFLQERGYYDIFLFDTKGNLVYTVFKELDYATNLISGEWASSDLGKAFRASRDNPKAGSKAFFDFKAYAPSYGAPASFISTSLLDNKGKLQGVLVFQMPIGKLNGLMQQKAGLGSSGESYVVGKDFLMRSDSRFSKESTILNTRIDTQQVRKALDGGSGLLIGDDYRGTPVMAAYKPIRFLNTTWAVVAEQDYVEALSSIISMRNYLLVGSGVGILLIILIGFFAGRSFSNPVTRMTAVMDQLAKGDNSVDIPGMERKDEIGEMAFAVEVFKNNAIKNDQLVAQQEEQALRTEQEKRSMMQKMADDFDASVGGIVETVSTASVELQSTAQSMAGISKQASDQASEASVASQQTSGNVQSVASATEEMNSTISEISQQVSQASNASRQAVTQVGNTSEQMNALADTANKIGEVVELISGIAEQTNLLALNATIESARAGEAGKGFAVVASEVKQLASQTAKATSEISDQISDIQNATKLASGSMDQVASAIAKVNEISTAIAAAMEEQGAATQEIAASVNQAAIGTQQVNDNITSVSQASQEAGAASGQVMSAAGELSQQAELLKGEVDRFISEVKAG